MENKKATQVIQILKETVQKKYPTLNIARVGSLVREVIYAPKSRMINVEDGKLSASDLRLMLAQTLEFDAMFAKSIETLNSETSSSQEYFRWLGDTTTILKHMNDGYVTTEDLKERNNFLDFTYQRETELMVCLGLYQGCKSKEAEERAKFIRYKLQKLREMRASIEFLTKSESNVESLRSEYDAAVPYYKYFKNLAKLPFGYDMPYEQKQKLGISHDEDADLKSDYDAFEVLVNNVLDVDTTKGSEVTSYEQSSDQIEELTGRKDLFHVQYDRLKNDN